MKNLNALIEGILFAAGTDVDTDGLASFLGEEPEVIQTVLVSLEQKYAAEEHGIRLVRHETSCRFSTKPELGPEIALFLSTRRPSLSSAAMEVLAIAAYNQPITKPYVSQIRGIASGEIIDSLVEKGLLREDGKLNLPGRPMAYVTTEKFLTVFGLESLADLPSLQESDPS